MRQIESVITTVPLRHLILDICGSAGYVSVKSEYYKSFSDFMETKS